MTQVFKLSDNIAQAVDLRDQDRGEEARRMLIELQRENPLDPSVNLQCAWTHDKLGLEHEAVPFYEKAIELGLEADDLKNAMLGLGSTYRTIGRYEEARSTLARAVERFPEDRGLQVFLAMTSYNTGNKKEACRRILEMLVDTTNDYSISHYEQAIRTYARDLDRIW